MSTTRGLTRTKKLKDPCGGVGAESQKSSCEVKPPPLSNKGYRPKRSNPEFGAIAQLGERYNGIVEVSGSIPLGSTKKNSLGNQGVFLFRIKEWRERLIYPPLYPHKTVK